MVGAVVRCDVVFWYNGGRTWRGRLSIIRHQNIRMDHGGACCMIVVHFIVIIFPSSLPAHALLIYNIPTSSFSRPFSISPYTSLSVVLFPMPLGFIMLDASISIPS